MSDLLTALAAIFIVAGALLLVANHYSLATTPFLIFAGVIAGLFIETVLSLSKNSASPVFLTPAEDTPARCDRSIHPSAIKRAEPSHPAIASATSWLSGPWPDRHSFNRLCVAENNDHSACAPASPRNKNRSQPRVTC